MLVSPPPVNVWSYRSGGSADGGPPDWSQHLFFTTLRIETNEVVGTGFLYQPSETEDGPIYLVTNKHVISRATQIRLHMIEAIGSEPFYGESIEIDLDTLSWIIGWRILMIR